MINRNVLAFAHAAFQQQQAEMKVSRVRMLVFLLVSLTCSLL